MKTLSIQPYLILLFLVIFCPYDIYAAKETPIPQTAYGSLSKYYMLEIGKKETNYIILYEQVTSNALLFIRSEINCGARSIRTLGSSSRSVKDITNNPSKWVNQPRIGTIQFDLITFVCK